jgi:hypothetical protein
MTYVALAKAKPWNAVHRLVQGMELRRHKHPHLFNRKHLKLADPSHL